jgi:hypothetical protein
MSTATDELITAYLTDLEREASRLPWHARTELLEDVRSHIEVALAELREKARGGGARGSGAGGARYGAGGVGDAGPDDGAFGGAAGSSGDAAGSRAGEPGSSGHAANSRAGDAGGAADPSAGAGVGDVDPGASTSGGAAGSAANAASSSAGMADGGVGSDGAAAVLGAGDAGGTAGPSAADAVRIVGGDAGSGFGARSADPAARSAEPAGTPSPTLSPADELSQVRAILFALGDPSEIVAAALADYPPQAAAPPESTYAPSPTPQGPPHPLGTSDICAVTLLLLGGFLAGIGWLIGAVLLWTSPRWSRLEKLIGTLVLPGGIAGGLFAFSVAHSGSYGECSGTGHCVTVHTGWNPPGWLTAITIAFVLAAPVATAVYLVNRAHLRPGPPASRVALAIVGGVGTFGLLAAVGLLAVANTSGAHASRPTPAPAEYSGSVPSGEVVPVSSPAQPPSSASAP